MGLVTGKAGELAFPGMQIVEIAVAIAKAGHLGRILLIHQRALVAFEAEPAQGNFQKVAMRRSMRCMAAKTFVSDDRLMHTLLCCLVVVTFITEPGRPVLYRAEASICLMIAVGKLVTRSTTVSLQGTMETGSAHFTQVTTVAGLAAEKIDRPRNSSKSRVGIMGHPQDCSGEYKLSERMDHVTPVRALIKAWR